VLGAVTPLTGNSVATSAVVLEDPTFCRDMSIVTVSPGSTAWLGEAQLSAMSVMPEGANITGDSIGEGWGAAANIATARSVPKDRRAKTGEAPCGIRFTGFLFIEGTYDRFERFSMEAWSVES
jgi:hypothetical protein